MADSNPYHELSGGVFHITCKPVVAGTHTAAWWNMNAGKGLYVCLLYTSPSPRD